MVLNNNRNVSLCFDEHFRQFRGVRWRARVRAGPVVLKKKEKEKGGKREKERGGEKKKKRKFSAILLESREIPDKC